MAEPKRLPFVIWQAGPPGCGKSRSAHNFLGADAVSRSLVAMVSSFPWFDEYDNEPVVCLDDIRKDSFPKFTDLLHHLDIYKKKVPVKGSFVIWNPRVIILTCPRVPEDEYVYHDRYHNGEIAQYEDIKQVTRRCHVIRVWNEMLNCWIYKKGSADALVAKRNELVAWRKRALPPSVEAPWVDDCSWDDRAEQAVLFPEVPGT